MQRVALIGARRTPMAAFQGSLSSLSAPELAAVAIMAAVTDAAIAHEQPKMLVGIALANRMARQIWAMLTKKEDYRDPALAVTA